ncbi:MAG: C-GCAxxG-C-C family protein [Candidatus Sumerlaeia bacterium]
MDVIDKAAERFASGYNCAQSVFSAFAEEMGMDVEESLKVASGFGGGMGHLGEVCGALTGAFMALGLARFDPRADVRGEKNAMNIIIAEAAERFSRRNNNCILCREILGYDISTEEGMQQAQSNNVFKDVCPNAVRDATEVVREMLAER